MENEMNNENKQVPGTALTSIENMCRGNRHTMLLILAVNISFLQEASKMFVYRT